LNHDGFFTEDHIAQADTAVRAFFDVADLGLLFPHIRNRDEEQIEIRTASHQEVLSFPGFHQLFFYGDYGDQLKDFCLLNGLKARVV